MDLADNYNVENPQIQFQPPPTFNQGQMLTNTAGQISQSLDSMFNTIIKQKLAQQQISQAQQEQSLQRGQVALSNAGVGGPDPIALGQALNQNPSAGASGQTGNFDLDNHIKNYISAAQASNRLGIAGAQADVAKKQAQAKLFQDAANQGGGQNGTIPTQSDTIGNQYIVTPNPETGMPKYDKVEPTPSISVGGQQVNLPPGGHYEPPPPTEITAANGIIQAKQVSDQLFEKYQQLAKQGKVGKLAGTWDAKAGQFTGGATSSEAVAFRSLARGLVGTLKTATDQNRLSPEIMDRLQSLFADPTMAPKAVNEVHNALNQALDNSLLIHTASYPTEAARIQRVQQALKSQSKGKSKYSGMTDAELLAEYNKQKGSSVLAAQ